MFQALCAWFYTGQPEIEIMLACHESVEEALTKAASAVVEAHHG